MKKVLIYSILLLVGLAGSQVLPGLFGESYGIAADFIRIATMIGLAFIMIHVGFEFHINKRRLKSYGWDYIVAFTAAFFPWIFVTAYFIFVMLPPEVWTNFDAITETLLAGRFAAPTSAGILFSMLTAAGLGSTWVYKKARILAIFDDLDTVLLMIPLKMLIVGIAWQLGLVVVFMALLLITAYLFLHKIKMPVTWKWVLFYSVLVVGFSEALYVFSIFIDPSVPVHIEVLLPAFVLGCVARPMHISRRAGPVQVEKSLHRVLSRAKEKKVATIVSGAFMAFVGLSMPIIMTPASPMSAAAGSNVLGASAYSDYAKNSQVKPPEQTITASQPDLPWSDILFHVGMITLISNIGKMFPLFCYRKEAHWRSRLGVAIGMWPRGEVGAGVLVLSLSFGIGGPIVTVAMLSLVLNLALSGVFIVFVKKLIEGIPESHQSF